MIEQILLTLVVLGISAVMSIFFWIIAAVWLQSTRRRGPSIFGLIFALPLLVTAAKAGTMIYRIWT